MKTRLLLGQLRCLLIILVIGTSGMSIVAVSIIALRALVGKQLLILW